MSFLKMGSTVAGESFHFLITSLQHKKHAINNSYVLSERMLKPCTFPAEENTPTLQQAGAVQRSQCAACKFANAPDLRRNWPVLQQLLLLVTCPWRLRRGKQCTTCASCREEPGVRTCRSSTGRAGLSGWRAGCAARPRG
jgi:hypothetical protein